MRSDLYQPGDTIMPPGPNFELRMGEESSTVTFHYRVNKTLRNRIKYWLFCQFFPFTITRWEKE